MQRSELLQRLQANEQWDIIVIGGGATGLGTAVDAASRGFKTLLLEAHDFGKGTSSRSTKLVHGGVRYLAQGNIGLVYEGLQERGRILRNAPHLARSLSFVVPGYRWWDTPFYGAGLLLYSVMAGRLGIGFAKLVGRKKVLSLAPTLEADGLLGGVVYQDGQFDDSRMLVTLLRTLQDLGGLAVNYMPVTAVCKVQEKVSGVVAQDKETGQELTLRARVVVNATGIFADSVRHMDEPHTLPLLAPSQGIHVVLDRSFLPGETAIMIPKTDDGRVLFIIPWHNHVIIGTTDTPVKDVSLEPRALPEELAFVMKHAARYLAKDPTPADVLSVYAGQRPLLKGTTDGAGSSTASLSREHTLLVSDTGLITITGGKWTAYRRMAEATVDQAITTGGLTNSACVTKDLHLHGYQTQAVPDPFGVYGSDAPTLKKLLTEQTTWASLLHPRLPYLLGEVVWAARFEMARTVEDVLARRTRALFLDAQASIEVAPIVAGLLAAEFGYGPIWQQSQVRQFEELAQGYLLPAYSMLRYSIST